MTLAPSRAVIGLRPQPLGVLPLPAGALLLPDVPGAAELAADLARGLLPAAWPPGLAFYADAAEGRVDAARAEVDRQLADGDPSSDAHRTVWLHNRAALSGSPADLEAALVEVTEPAARAVLLAAAFSAGSLDSPPELTEDTDAELRAFVLLAVASEAVEHGPARSAGVDAASLALAALADGVAAAREASPALAAQLLGTRCGLLAEAGGDPAEVITGYAQALDLLDKRALPEVRASLLYDRGVALQAAADGRAGMLKEAVRCYQQALVVFRRQTHPELFAEAQTNLALAYLATPMVDAGDHLRLGIAVQALRDALEVWTRGEHPQRWASVTLNLANALQYLPSAHQEDNLAEAVEHYEELLGVRDPEADPAGCARVLANQGNALAHLGILDHAEAKLTEAAGLFRRAGDSGAAAAVGETLAEVAERRAARASV